MRLSEAVAVAPEITILVQGRGTPGPRGADGANGINGSAGTNVDSIGLLVTANGSDVHSAELVRTSGNDVVGKGSASYAKDNTVDLGAYPKAGFTDNGGQKYRITHEWGLNTRSFYEPTDPDYYNACRRALDYSLSLATAGVGYGKGGPQIFTPPDRYDIGQPIDIDFTVIFEGHGGYGPSGGATIFQPTDPTNPCFRTQAYNSSGNTSGSVVTGKPGAQGAILRNFGVHGAFAGTEHVDGTAVLIRSTCQVENVYADNMPGNGFEIRAYNTSPTINGNANDTDIRGCFATACTIGFRAYAPDTNSSSLWHPNANSNRQYGISLDGLIGMNVWGGDVSSNGQIAGFPTTAHRLGNWFDVIPGQELWCSTHAPPDTATNNQGWRWRSAGYIAAERPDWVSGMTWRAGGGVRVSGFSFCKIAGLYAESDQVAGWFDQNASLWDSPLGGTPLSLDCTPYGGAFTGTNAGLLLAGGIRMGGDYTGNDLGKGTVALLENINEIFRLRPHGGGAHIFMDCGGGFPAFRDTNGHAPIYWNSANGLLGPLNTGDYFAVNGIQVLNGQMAALADLAAAPTQADFNALLARLRGVKLMAP